MSEYAIKKVGAYLKHYGVSELLKKFIERRSDRDNYMEIRKSELSDDAELERQRGVVFDYEPVISIIIPVYNAPKDAFVKTLLSVKEQTYSKWELCINDAGDNQVEAVVREVFSEDSRVKYNYSDTRLGISLNSNKALKMATGDYVALLDHDDLLEKDALYYMVKAVNESGAPMLYSDEDKVNEDFTEYFRPFRKPDFNKMLFLSNNYICHFCLIKRDLVEMVGGFRSEYDGAQDYDLFLRCMEKAEKIEHVSRVLYHWRVTKKSTSDNPFNKNYATDAGKKALEDYLIRNNLRDKVEVLENKDPGYYTLNYIGEVSMDEYELILPEGVEVHENTKELMIRRAVLAGADVVAPKIISGGKYFYNGVAGRGDELTWSLFGKPKWYRGKFNLGITPMNVCLAPRLGVLVKNELVEQIKGVNGEYIDNRLNEFSNLVMVYEPRAHIEIKR